MTNSNASSTFCILPFLHAFTSAKGDLRACCVSEDFGNKLQNSDGKELIMSDAIETSDILNNQVLVDMRKLMLDGKRPKACLRCFQTEDGGSVSHRQRENQNLSQFIEKALQNCNEEGVLSSPELRSLDLRVGNTCNLSCIMCSPEYTKKLAKNWNDLSLEKIEESELDNFKKNNWFKNPELQMNLAKMSKDVVQINFGGGEPLYDPEVGRFLEIFSSIAKAKNVSLTFNTNITVVPDWAYKIFPKFKDVSLFCSIDGIGRVNEIIRQGSSWTQIEENLQTLENDFEKLNLKAVHFNATIQNLNISNIGEMISYFKKFRKLNNVPLFTNLYHPRYLSTQTLPKKYKEKVSLELEKLIKESAQLSEENIKNIYECLNYMNAIYSMKGHLLSMKYFKNLEKTYNFSLTEIIPDFDRYDVG